MTLRAAPLLLLAIGACVGDPTGPGVLFVTAVGARADTVWSGAPGEPIPSVAIRVKDADGELVAGAAITWEAVGRNAQIIYGSAETDAHGFAAAVWQLGTDASEEQQLRVMVQSRHRPGVLTLRARAVPHVVAQLRVSVDSPAVLRVGDSLPIAVTAIDPFGNTFPAPPARLSLSDTTMGKVIGSVVVGGPRRGATDLTVISDYVTSRIPLHVVQYVAAIIPAVDTLTFRSLGAVLPIAYRVRDDRGRVVGDTIATVSIADTSVAQVTDTMVRASRPGLTALRLAVGAVTENVAINVQQRIASLQLRDTIRFDALRDTTTIYAIARDSLGYPVLNPDLVFEVANDQVVTLSPDRSLEAVTPGVTVLTLRDAVTGVTASAPIVVQQRVATIDVPQIAFDALGDTVPIAAVPHDRLGSVVVGAPLTYSISDSGVVRAESGRRLRSAAEGRAVLTVTDPETGTVGTADVIVAQRVRTLTLSKDSIGYDALGDSTPVTFDARDRLGAAVNSATVSYSSTEPSVVSVDPQGVTRSVGNGSALIIAASSDGPADTVRLTVAQRVIAIRLDQDSLLFESLHAVRTAGAHPIDRLGAVVLSASLSYAVEDSRIAEVDGAGEVRAVANGTTGLLLVVGADTSRVGLRVTQRPVRVSVSADTIRFQAFGDSVTLGATALDSLGSPVASGITGFALDDPAIAVVTDSSTVHATANGVTHATIGVAGITGQVVVIVNQVPTTLNVSVTFGNPVITLPTGAPLPLLCQAADRNGYAIAGEPAFVGSVKGTVTGSGCANAQVARSGYDTLVFAAGAVQTRIGVIVATVPDSVGVITAAQPLTTVTRIRYEGEDLENPAVLALRPMVQEILAEYGNPTTNLGKARALRDWIARTAVHPHPPLHPDGSTANLGVLPPGKTWFDVNTIIYHQSSPDSMTNASNAYWRSVGYDGYAMLDRLLGTLDPATGLRADDGMMVHLGGARYQIRDLQSYRYPICTFQAIMLNALWAAARLQGMLSSTIDHDPAAVFIPDLNKWVYEDPTFNEEYSLDGVGDPLSPAELLGYSSSGEAGRLRAIKFPGPTADPETYIPAESYVGEHPAGMTIMGSQLNSRVVGIGGWSTRLVQIDGPLLATAPPPWSNPLSYVPVASTVAFPILAPIIDRVDLQDSVYVVQLSSTFPSAVRLERRVNAGQWESASSVDVLPVGQCLVEYRSLDEQGNYSATTRLDIWVPRGQGFLEQAVPGSTRSTSRYCAPWPN